MRPAVHPDARAGASMAYNVATGTVVLGSLGAQDFITWTWG